jgi:hypothetical protein
MSHHLYVASCDHKAGPACECVWYAPRTRVVYGVGHSRCTRILDVLHMNFPHIIVCFTSKPDVLHTIISRKFVCFTSRPDVLHTIYFPKVGCKTTKSWMQNVHASRFASNFWSFCTRPLGCLACPSRFGPSRFAHELFRNLAMLWE